MRVLLLILMQSLALQVWGHAVVVDPPSYLDRTGRLRNQAGSCPFAVGTASTTCMAYENFTFIPDGSATIKEFNPLKTMRNCPRETYQYLPAGSDTGCILSPGLPDGEGFDTTRTHPWRAPGRAPITSPCGILGGNPQGCPAGNPRSTGCFDGGYGHGQDLRDRMNDPLMISTQWRAGSQVEIKLGLHANHNGGYSYRLCKKPARWQDLTEECFQEMPLDFVGDTAWIEYVSGGRRVPIPMLTANGSLTWPVGSQWRRNPIPCCVYNSIRGGPCLGTMFPPFDGRGLLSEFKGYGPFNAWSIVDLVQVPNIPPGDYVLGWRWDGEQFKQVWSGCSNIRIV